MTGPIAASSTAPDTTSPTLAERPESAPTGPVNFVQLLAQLLGGTGAIASDALLQPIGESRADLEPGSQKKPDAHADEQPAADPLLALSLDPIPTAPPQIPPPPLAAGQAGGTAPEAPRVVASATVSETAQGIWKMGASSPSADAQAGVGEVAAAPPLPKPVAAPRPPVADTAAEAASTPSRIEESRPSAPHVQPSETGAATRRELARAVDGAGEGAFRGSSDGDAGDPRGGHGEREHSQGIGLIADARAASGPAAAGAADGGQRTAPAATTRSPVEQVADHIGIAHREGREEVSFRLEPPELGAVRIQAVLDGQRLTLHIRTEHDAARVALEQSLPQLRETLSQQGIEANRVTIELGLDASSRGFSDQGFAGSQRQEPAEAPPAPSHQVTSHAAPAWREPAREGFDLWV